MNYVWGTPGRLQSTPSPEGESNLFSLPDPNQQAQEWLELRVGPALVLVESICFSMQETCWKASTPSRKGRNHQRSHYIIKHSVTWNDSTNGAYSEITHTSLVLFCKVAECGYQYDVICNQKKSICLDLDSATFTHLRKLQWVGLILTQCYLPDSQNWDLLTMSQQTFFSITDIKSSPLAKLPATPHPQKKSFGVLRWKPACSMA